MKRLTREQELKVIQMTYEVDDYIDNGGGRVVFDLPYKAVKFLGLDNNKDYVIKIALGEKGLSQNLLEISSYEHYCDQVALATIEAAGQVVEIMEKVDTSFASSLCDYYDEEGYFDENDLEVLFIEDYDMEEKDAYHYAREICVLISQLEDINGVTADNTQLGIDSSNHFVSYDYGFDRDRGCDEQCSDTRDYVYNKGHRHTLLNLIMELIVDEPELFDNDNVNFMAEVETQFFNYLHEDDCEEEDICGYNDHEDTDTIESLHGFTMSSRNVTKPKIAICANAPSNIAAIYWERWAENNNALSCKYCENITITDYAFKIPENILTDWQKNTIIYHIK